MSRKDSKPTLVWVYTASLHQVLDAATWLFTAQGLRDLGWDVTLIAVGPSGIQKIRGVEVLCISRPEVYLLRHIIYQIKAAFFILRKLATFDVVLYHDYSVPFFVPIRWISYLLGKRRPYFVLDTRTLPMPPVDKGTLKDKIRRMSYNVTNEWGNRFSDGRLAITRRMAEAAHIPPAKLWGAWPSGVEDTDFAESRARRSWPSAKDPINLIYHGHMGYERNLMALCHAVTKANAKGMRFRLSLIGEGPETPDLEAYAANTDGLIKIIHSIPYEDIPKQLAQAHIGVLPFPDEEKFRTSSPIKLFEYMAAGLPILATRIFCHTDVIVDGDYVFWAEGSSDKNLLDALEIVWQSRDALNVKGQMAANAVEDWTWLASAKKLKAALEKGLLERRTS